MSVYPNPNYGPAANFAQGAGTPAPGLGQGGHGSGNMGHGRVPAAFAPQPAAGAPGGFSPFPPVGSVAGLLALANLRNQMLEGQSRALLVMSCRAAAVRPILAAGQHEPTAKPVIH